MVALGIIALLAAISIPWFARMFRQNRLSGVTRVLIGNIQVMRSEASARRVINQGPPLERVALAGINFDGPQQYTLVTVSDAGTVTTVRTVDLLAEHQDTKARFRNPLPGPIRFRSDGTALAGMSIVLEDTDIDEDRTIQITGVGHIRMLD